LTAAGIAVAISLSWPAALLFICWLCRDKEWFDLAWKWIKIEATYSIVHPVFFSIAIGVFVATCTRDVCLPRARKGWLWPFVSLAGLCLLTLWVAVSLLFTGHLDSYELAHPCDAIRKDYTLQKLKVEMDLAESKLKALRTDDPEIKQAASDFKTRQQAYETNRKEYLEAREKPKEWRKVISSTSIITWINLLLSIFFLLFCAIVVWYFLMAVYNGKLDEAKPVLITTILLLTAWLPARAYANFCEAQAAGDSATNAEIVFAAVIVVLVFFAFFILAVIDRRIPWDLAKYLLGIFVGGITFMVVTIPGCLPAIKSQVEKFPPSMFVALCVLTVAILTLCIRQWFQPISNYLWQASASSTAPGNSPSNVLLRVSEAHWRAANRLASNQWFQIDLGSIQTFKRLVMESAGDEYPRNFAVKLSNTDTSWPNLTPASECIGDGPTVSVQFAHALSAQFVRIELTATDEQHDWSIREFKLYRF
jgi:hypothetical protein